MKGRLSVCEQNNPKDLPPAVRLVPDQWPSALAQPCTQVGVQVWAKFAPDAKVNVISARAQVALPQDWGRGGRAGSQFAANLPGSRAAK
jgi:hypothetical protein